MAVPLSEAEADGLIFVTVGHGKCFVTNLSTSISQLGDFQVDEAVGLYLRTHGPIDTHSS